MTSFMIAAHKDRQLPIAWKPDDICPFCRIIAGEGSAHRLYEDENVVAILDILPLRAGHALVIPKHHCQRLSDLPEKYAAAVGIAVSKVARALTLALGNTALNVVANQEYAQAVAHVHYHVIPAPQLNSSNGPPATISHKVPLDLKEMHQLEFEGRTELDDDLARVLVQTISAKL